MFARRTLALLVVAAVVAIAARLATAEFGDALLGYFAGTLAMLPALVAVAPFLEQEPQSNRRSRKVSRLRSPSRV